MSSALPLFDRMFEPGELNRPVNIGAALKERGIEVAYDKAVRVKSAYVDRCLEAIKSFPKGAMITSEDIRSITGDVPKEIDKSIMAAILKRAAAQKLIAITDRRVHAKRTSLHAAELRQWRRL